MRKLVLAIAAAFAGSASAAQPQSPPLPPPPRLLIVLSVDGLSSDLFEKYRPHFRGGLARLSRGTVFRNAITGQAHGGTALGDLLKSRHPRSITGAVTGGQGLAAGLAGSMADASWSWADTGFSSERTGIALQRTNAAVRSMIAAAQPALIPPAACGAAPGGRFARAAGDSQAFANSPALDAAVLAASAALAQQLGLGSDGFPDLLAVDLPATGRVARAFPGDAVAQCLQLLSLDRDLGDFLRLMDRSGTAYGVALVPSPGSGGAADRVPFLLWRPGLAPSERTDRVTAADVVATLAAMLRLPPPPGVEGKCLAGIEEINCPAR